MNACRSLVVSVAIACGLALGAAQAQQAKQPQSSTEREAKTREFFTDTLLRTESDRTIRFYSDALKDKVVLINFVFTQCGDTCPLITARLVQAKKELGEAFGRDVRFLSVTRDPQQHA